MLSDPRDLIRMRDAVGRLLTLTQHSEIRKVSESVQIGRTLEFLEDRASTSTPTIPSDRWMLEHCFDVQHAAGTCRMGAANDPRSVVDPDCRVLGVEGLRVIDASIFPEMVRANTHLTAVMIGEHMAERIRSRPRRQEIGV
jgi:choline dehydrogenase